MMKKKRGIILILCAAVLAGTLVFSAPSGVNAFFGIITIEDLMEWFGINRTDRSKDIKENMLRSVELSYILPELVFKGGDLKSMIGLDALPQIPDIAKDFEDFQSELEELYEIPGSIFDSFTGQAFPDGAVGSILSRGGGLAKKASSVNWKSYEEEPVAVLEKDKGKVKKEPRIYKAVDEMIKKEWKNSDSPSFGEFDTSMFEGAGVAAFTGTLSMPEAHIREGMLKGAAQYGQDVKEGRIKKITELIAETEITAYRIKERIKANEKKITDNIGTSMLKFNKDGGAWKGTAASYSSIVQQNIDNQMLIADLQTLLRLRLRMKAQTASLLLYDYVQYCNNTLIARYTADKDN